MKNILRYQIPPLLWALLIFIASSISQIPEVKAPLGTDKVVHLAIYFVFCWLTYRALFHQTKFSFLARHAFLIAFLLTCLYGYLDEVHQLYVEGRTYDLYDWTADALGGAFYVVVAHSALRWQQWKERRKTD